MVGSGAARELWLWIDEHGGRMTETFDPTLFPAGTRRVRGPLGSERKPPRLRDGGRYITCSIYPEDPIVVVMSLCPGTGGEVVVPPTGIAVAGHAPVEPFGPAIRSPGSGDAAGALFDVDAWHAGHRECADRPEIGSRDASLRRCGNLITGGCHEAHRVVGPRRLHPRRLSEQHRTGSARAR